MASTMSAVMIKRAIKKRLNNDILGLCRVLNIPIEDFNNILLNGDGNAFTEEQKIKLAEFLGCDIVKFFPTFADNFKFDARKLPHKSQEKPLKFDFQETLNKLLEIEKTIT